jgi:hypothetical protein
VDQVLRMKSRQRQLSGHSRHFTQRDSNSTELPGAALAGLNIDIEHTLEPLHPGHRHMALGGRLVQPVYPGGLTPLALPAPPHRRYPHTKFAIGGENPMKTCQIDAVLGNEGGQLRDEIQAVRI